MGIVITVRRTASYKPFVCDLSDLRTERALVFIAVFSRFTHSASSRRGGRVAAVYMGARWSRQCSCLGDDISSQQVGRRLVIISVTPKHRESTYLGTESMAQDRPSNTR